jgi:hypothetical protein
MAAVLLLSLWESFSVPRACDTTYIWEGYEQVAIEHPRYKLIKSMDGDPERQKGVTQLQALPCLIRINQRVLTLPA